ncbi:uncharacterized protein LOC143215108 isoform X5 [Lasioglossum baleicum]|uniref:uncharacterized protein LOC143215108 isoform X5 n=1 Tax=Lasioglossum baleicum TaxID=434251 RepID=UPI003FCD43CE
MMFHTEDHVLARNGKRSSTARQLLTPSIFTSLDHHDPFLSICLDEDRFESIFVHDPVTRHCVDTVS